METVKRPLKVWEIRRNWIPEASGLDGDQNYSVVSKDWVGKSERHFETGAQAFDYLTKNYKEEEE